MWTQTHMQRSYTRGVTCLQVSNSKARRKTWNRPSPGPPGSNNPAKTLSFGLQNCEKIKSLLLSATKFAVISYGSPRKGTHLPTLDTSMDRTGATRAPVCTGADCARHWATAKNRSTTH